MPDSNTEIWERLIAAFNERGTDGALEYFSEDAEVYDPDFPPDAPRRGHGAVRYVIEQLTGGFVSLQAKDVELIPSGDRVVGLIDTHGRAIGIRGEMEVSLRTAHTMTFRDGLIVYWRLYAEHAEALSDAGLEARSAQGPGAPQPREGGGDRGAEAT